MKLIILFCLFFSLGICTPPVVIPEELYSAFTMDKRIPVIYLYRNDSYSSDQPIVFKTDEIDAYITQASDKQVYYYGMTDTYLYQALDRFRDVIENKNVAVIGSTTPWYESILLSYKAHPTTIEYNKIISLDPRIEVMTVKEYEEHPKKFDAIVSISSIEHDGLGRYGDLVNPNADLEMMEKAKKMLKEGGLLFLSVPVGQDCLVWNLHRVYGKIRLKALLKGWRILGYYGFTYEDLEQDRPLAVHQPVFILKSL